MGSACLEVSQPYAANIGPAFAAPELLVKVRREKARRIDSRGSRESNFDSIAAPRIMGKEWAIVQQAIAGNVDAHEYLFAPHLGRLYRKVFALLQNKEDAEDAMQDGLFKAFTSLRSFEGRSSFSTWLTRIVVNSALMTRRRKSAHPEASLDEILYGQPERWPQGVVDTHPDPENTCAANEIKALVEEQVRRLSPALQTAFRLHAMNGLSAVESSEALGIRATAFRSRLLRARRKLVCGLKRSLEISPTALSASKGHA